MDIEKDECYGTPKAMSEMGVEDPCPLNRYSSESSSEFYTPANNSPIKPVCVEQDTNESISGQRQSERRELFEQIENIKKKLPPSQRKRVLDVNNIKSIQIASTTQDIQRTINKPELLTNSENDSIKVKNSNKKETCKAREQTRRSSTRLKLNKVVENDRLTPMGLPKPIRMSKSSEISLEDIYMQKDYRTPKTSSSLPTIIDENDPKIKKTFMTRAKRTRHIEFETNPAERKPRKRRNSIRVQRNSTRNKRKNSTDSMNLLKSKLAKLDEELSQDDEL